MLFSYVIKKSTFFKDDKIPLFIIYVAFIIKITGIFFYILVYSNNASAYSFNSDTQSILHDAQIIYKSLFVKPGDFFQLILGFHSSETSGYFHENYFSKMEKWFSVGKSDFLLNDNQTITKLNALLMVFSFGKFYAHALLNCLLSFMGGLFIYKTFKRYFAGKEKLLFLITLFIPSVYFWTSAVLKEPFVIFFLGGFLLSYFTIFVFKKITFSNIIFFTFSVFGLLILKPYLIGSLLFPLIAFTLVENKNFNKIILSYFTIILPGLILSILLSYLIFNKNVFSIISKRQNDFVSIGYGGTFLYGNGIYLRLNVNEFNKIKLKDSSLQLYTLKTGISYMYWNYPNLKDTVFVANNTDTIGTYELKNSIIPSKSLIEKRLLEPTFSSYLIMMPKAIINAFFYPFFIGCKTNIQLLASIENLFFLIFLISSIYFMDKTAINKNLLFFFSSSVMILFVLIGYSTAIGGALVRYKMPFLPFLWMIPLLLFDLGKIKLITAKIRSIIIPLDKPVN